MKHLLAACCDQRRIMLLSTLERQRMSSCTMVHLVNHEAPKNQYPWLRHIYKVRSRALCCRIPRSKLQSRTQDGIPSEDLSQPQTLLADKRYGRVDILLLGYTQSPSSGLGKISSNFFMIFCPLPRPIKTKTLSLQSEDLRFQGDNQQHCNGSALFWCRMSRNF